MRGGGSMSRSGYTGYCDGWELIRWRGAVNSAIKGKRGQSFLRELLAALDAMPRKRLIRGELIESGEFCTLGVIGQRRGIPIDQLDPYDTGTVADTFRIAEALVKEIMELNDGPAWRAKEDTPEARWERMRKWVISNLAAPNAGE